MELVNSFPSWELARMLSGAAIRQQTKRHLQQPCSPQSLPPSDLSQGGRSLQTTIDVRHVLRAGATEWEEKTGTERVLCKHCYILEKSPKRCRLELEEQ